MSQYDKIEDVKVVVHFLDGTYTMVEKPFIEVSNLPGPEDHTEYIRKEEFMKWRAEHSHHLWFPRVEVVIDKEVYALMADITGVYMEGGDESSEVFDISPDNLVGEDTNVYTLKVVNGQGDVEDFVVDRSDLKYIIALVDGGEFTVDHTDDLFVYAAGICVEQTMEEVLDLWLGGQHFFLRINNYYVNVRDISYIMEMPKA